ncbi:MarR family transcriptional regulator [Streptomyces sp. NPDC000151]|uniref:MarR family winged helix-turn-helix transcriptional regulator n=1 Tax=Streptomyces sp. NPDC000151 TaxID=3154244 RepID=UPI0033258C01
MHRDRKALPMLPPPSRVREQWAAHHPGLDTSPMEVVALLKQITALVDRAVEPLYEGAPLTAPEVDLLIPLRHADEPVIARRLAERMSISRAGASKALAKLEKRGFIARTPNPADRRAALVTVTQAGKDAVDALFPRQLAIEAELLEGLGEDREHVLNALARLAEVLQQASAS